MAGKKQQGRGRGGQETTGGGEFSEGGGSGRSSTGSGTGGGETGYETSRQTSTASGNQGLSGESSSSGGSKSSSKESGKSGRYSIDCAEAGQGCSLKVSGTYDEVISAGVEHGRSAHGMTGDDQKLRKDIEGYIHEEREPGSGMPGSYQGRGQSQSGTSPSLPS